MAGFLGFDLNFNNSYGSYLTRQNVVDEQVDAEIAAWWKLAPTGSFPYVLKAALARYSATFEAYFQASAISFHAHASDACNPSIIMSFLQEMSSEERRGDNVNPKILRVSAEQQRNPRLAIMEGSYGGSYGPMATHKLHDNYLPSNGVAPIVIRLNQDNTNVERQLRRAMKQGCCGLMVEIVRSRDGTVLRSQDWRDIVKACTTLGLCLIVDEAMTAIRCGAPFAYQRPEYAIHGRPDLIIFGKAVRVCGLAADWEGINLSQLGLTNESKEDDIRLQWQKSFTSIVPIGNLLISLGTLILATQQDWTRRARDVGAAVRELAPMVFPLVSPRSLGGLDALIYLPIRNIDLGACVQFGATGPNHVRWLPALDDFMTSATDLYAKAFGKESTIHRNALAEWLEGNYWEPQWCYVCGESFFPHQTTGSCDFCAQKYHVECEREKMDRPDHWCQWMWCSSAASWTDSGGSNNSDATEEDGDVEHDKEDKTLKPVSRQTSLPGARNTNVGDKPPSEHSDTSSPIPCTCTTACRTRRCPCIAASRLCLPTCHAARPTCSNKRAPANQISSDENGHDDEDEDEAEDADKDADVDADHASGPVSPSPMRSSTPSVNENPEDATPERPDHPSPTPCACRNSCRTRRCPCLAASRLCLPSCYTAHAKCGNRRASPEGEADDRDGDGESFGSDDEAEVGSPSPAPLRRSSRANRGQNRFRHATDGASGTGDLHKAESARKNTSAGMGISSGGTTTAETVMEAGTTAGSSRKRRASVNLVSRYGLRKRLRR